MLASVLGDVLSELARRYPPDADAEAGVPAVELHGNLAQNARNRNMAAFSDGSAGTLVATDIAARGIDVPRVGHIINFEMPETVEDYIHRAGRTARGEAVGIVSTIATWQDLPMVRKIEETLGEKIARCSVPGVEAWEEMEKKPSRERRRV